MTLRAIAPLQVASSSPVRISEALTLEMRETTGGLLAATPQRDGLALWERTEPELLASVRSLEAAAPTLEKAAVLLEAGRCEEALPLLGHMASEHGALRAPLAAALPFLSRLRLQTYALALFDLGFGYWPAAIERLHATLAEPGPGQGSSLALAHLLREIGEEQVAISALERARVGQRREELCRACFPHSGHVLFQHPELLEHVRGVVQIGANIGDECPAFADIGIQHLLCFEPVAEARAVLDEALARHRAAGRDWRSVGMAISDREGELEFWQGRESGNSSFLALHPDRPAAHLHNVHDRKIVVRTATLDGYVEETGLDLGAYQLLFMDVQGVEHQVISGAPRSLEQLEIVVMEVSYCEIYEGSLCSEEMAAFMEQHGFRRYAEEPGSNPDQADAIYLRRGGRIERLLQG